MSFSYVMLGLSAATLYEALGLFAGSLIVISSWPQIQYNLGFSKEAATASKLRQMLIVLGNLLWVLYGALNHSVAIWFMCSINVILNLVIYFQINNNAHFTQFLKGTKNENIY